MATNEPLKTRSPKRLNTAHGAGLGGPAAPHSTATWTGGAGRGREGPADMLTVMHKTQSSNGEEVQKAGLCGPGALSVLVVHAVVGVPAIGAL